MELRFYIFVGIKNVSLGIVNRQVSDISDRVMALVNEQKVVFKASSSFTLWNIRVKFHKND